jgi:thioredoxin 1
MNKAKNNSKTITVDLGNFDSEVFQSKIPVLVAFSAHWSRPCQILAPVLEEIAAERSVHLKVATVNADDNPDLSVWFDVRLIPTLLFFGSGTVRAKIVGTATKEAILAKLDSMSKAAAETTNPCAVDLWSGAHKPKGE